MARCHRRPAPPHLRSTRNRSGLQVARTDLKPTTTKAAARPLELRIIVPVDAALRTYRFGYAVGLAPIAASDPEVGSPTPMAVFKRVDLHGRQNERAFDD